MVDYSSYIVDPWKAARFGEQTSLQRRGLDLQQHGLDLRERELRTRERLNQTQIQEKLLDVYRQQAGFLADGLKSVTDQKSLDAFNSVAEQMTRQGMLHPQWAKNKIEVYDPKAVSNALSSLEKVSGQLKYEKPEQLGGAWAQKESRTGKYTQVVGQKASQLGAKYTPIKTSTGIYKMDKTTGQIEPVVSDTGEPLMPVTADVELVGQKKAAQEEAKAQVEKKFSFPKARNARDSLLRQWDMVEQTIDEAIELASPWTTGLGAWAKAIPASPQKRLSEKLETIKANLGFDKLQEMRANSPTGGALGPVSDFENQLLQKTQGSLVQEQDTKTLVKNLQRIKERLRQTRERTTWAYEQDFADYITAAPTQQPPPPAQAPQSRFKILKVE